MTEDPFASKEWKAYANRAIRDLVPKLQASAISVTIANGLDPEEGGDAKLAIELGFTLLMGKPLVLLVDEDQVIPPGLERAADVICRGDLSDESYRAEEHQKIKDLVATVPE